MRNGDCADERSPTGVQPPKSRKQTHSANVMAILGQLPGGSSSKTFESTGHELLMRNDTSRKKIVRAGISAKCTDLKTVRIAIGGTPLCVGHLEFLRACVDA